MILGAKYTVMYATSSRHRITHHYTQNMIMFLLALQTPDHPLIINSTMSTLLTITPGTSISTEYQDCEINYHPSI